MYVLGGQNMAFHSIWLLSHLIMLPGMWSISSQSNNFPPSELTALHDLFDHTNGGGWKWSQGGTPWNFSESDPNPCYEQWEGVACSSYCLGSSSCNVLNISLPTHNLTGQLPNSLGSFRKLQWLDLRFNELTGSIPETIGNLTELKALDLGHNRLVHTLPESLGNLTSLEIFSVRRNLLLGEIPESIGNMRNLRILQLKENYLQKQIPPTLGQLTNLTILDLASNMLSGTIVESLVSLHELKVLELSFNELNGTIPSWIGGMNNLNYLGLRLNGFCGSIPKSIFALSKLQYLNIRYNDLTGVIPNEIGNLTELRVLAMGLNQLHGTIPNTICNLSKLEILYIDNTLISGYLPAEFGQLTNLQVLALYYNALSGPFSPGMFQSITNLRIFSLNHNRFSKTLPDNLENLNQLREYSVEFNYLTGGLPTTLSLCKNLDYASFSGNYLSGPIPEAYGELHHFMFLYLFSNNLWGPIPTTLMNLTNLRDFELEYNLFSHTIPEAIGSLQNLLYLGLSDNRFSGSLPDSLRFLKSLVVSTLQNNFFTGTLPLGIGHNWSTIEVLLLQNNLFSGTIDVIDTMKALTNLNVSSNKFTGSLSHLQFNYPYLTSLDLSNNRFTGTLNGVFANLPYLLNLNLAHNQFSGNLESMFGSGSLVLVDISDNIFSGSLPRDVFNFSGLQTFAAVKNCLTGALPTDVICASRSLYTLALDGLHTADRCQDRFFPSLSSMTSYQLVGASRGSLPHCLFNMHNLQTLHLSGNGFSGSIPDDVIPNSNMSDISLSYNQLTGSIPVWMQEKAWKSLDVSVNKLKGVLKSTFATPANSTSLTMTVNRLSGDIPSSLMEAEQIAILQGNIFRCDANGVLGDSSRSLPHADAEASTYDCGSDSVNSAMYIWVAVSGAIIMGLIVAIMTTAKCHKVQSEGKEEVLAVNADQRVKEGAQLLNNIRYICREWMNRYLHIFLSKESDQDSHRNDSSYLSDASALYELGHSLTVIRTMAWMITGFAVCVLMPTYSVLSVWFSTHNYVYIWTVALAYLSGWTPALVIFVIMVGFYVLLGSKLLAMLLVLRSHHGDKQHDYPPHVTTVGNVLYSLVRGLASHCVERHDIERAGIYYGVVVFNVVIVLAVNVAYVYTTTLSLNQSAVFFVEVAISIFKITWSAFMVSSAFSKMLSFENEVNSKEVGKGRAHTITKLKFLCQLTMFNNIVAPFLADAFVDPDCFRYVINSRAAVTASYNSEVCYIYGFNMDQSQATAFCYQMIFDKISTTYNPPFVYSYQCTSALLNGFVNVFIYRYLITGILLPCARLLLTYLHEEYKIWDHFYGYTEWLAFSQSTTVVRKVACANGPKVEEREESAVQLQSFGDNRSFLESSTATTLSISNPMLSAEGCSDGNSEDAAENAEVALSKDTVSIGIVRDESAESGVTTTTISEDWLLKVSQAAFNKEAILVSIVGDFAVLLTFGLTFPLLAIAIAVSILSNTLYHQMLLNRVVTTLQTAIVNPVRSSVEATTRCRSIWSVTTSSSLSRHQAEHLLKQITAHCGGNLMELFWPVIPSLAVLSAVFVGVFLFDILGDEVGALRALWILLTMSTMPLLVWCGERLLMMCLEGWNHYRSNECRSEGEAKSAKKSNDV